jgi:predicted Zn-dependent protease
MRLNPVSAVQPKLAIRATAQEPASKPTPAAADQGPTTKSIVADVKKAAAPFKPEIEAAVAKIDGAPDEAEQLRALYEKVAAKVVATLNPTLDETLGQLQLAGIKKTAKMLPDDDPLTIYLQGVVDRVAGPSTRYHYKVRVIDGPEVNAFNAGGSTMVVYTGLLKTIKNEAELAGVLGHEMTHGENHDVMTKVAMQELAGFATGAVAERHKVESHGVLNFFKKIGAKGQETAHVIGFGKTSYEVQRDLQKAIESRADAGGVRRLATAGYDPGAVAGWFERMAPQLDAPAKGLFGMLEEYMNDHPSSASRVKAIRAQIDAEKLGGGKNDRNDEAYLKATAKYRPAPEAAK